MEGFEIDFDILEHYGTKYHSGRYPYGSGDNPYQHDGGLRGYVKEMREQGLSDEDIAHGMHMTIKEMKLRLSVEKMEERNLNYEKVIELSEKGYNTSEIARIMNKNESSIRSCFLFIFLIRGLNSFLIKLKNLS